MTTAAVALFGLFFLIKWSNVRIIISWCLAAISLLFSVLQRPNNKKKIEKKFSIPTGSRPCIENVNLQKCSPYQILDFPSFKKSLGK